MAGVNWNANTPVVSLAAATAKTVLQIVAPANQRLLVRRFHVSFQGVANSDKPVLVEVVRQSTAGTMSALTLTKGHDGDDETLQATAQHTATVEPTTGDVLWRDVVHPQGGTLQVLLPESRPIPVKGGGRLGIRCTATDAVDCVAGIGAEE